MRVAQQALARRWWFAMLMGFILLACTFLVQARTPQEVQVQATLLVTDMPREGQATYQKILKGGPFPYEKDGTVVGNRERLLPREARGFYPRIHRQDARRASPWSPPHRLWRHGADRTESLLLHRRPLRELSPDR